MYKKMHLVLVTDTCHVNLYQCVSIIYINIHSFLSIIYDITLFRSVVAFIIHCVQVFMRVCVKVSYKICEYKLGLYVLQVRLREHIPFSTTVSA